MVKEIKKQSKVSPYFLLGKYFKVIAPVLFVVVLVAGYFIVIGSQISAFTKLKQVDLSNAMSENQHLKANREYLRQLANNKFLSADEEKSLSMAVPNGFDFTSIVSQLTSLAQAYNFNITSIQADKIKSDNAISPSGSLMTAKVYISISGGNYDQFKLFLDGMEKSAMIFDVQSVSFGKNNSYQLEILAYYF